MSVTPDVAIDFIETHILLIDDRWAGEPFKLAKWQREWVHELLSQDSTGLRKYSRGVLGIPRGNGKSTLASALMLTLMALDVGHGGELYSLAGDKLQARIVFDTAKKMVEASPLLSDFITPYRDYLIYEKKDIVYRVLSADAKRQQGLRPSIAIVDEVHVLPDEELWVSMEAALMKREEPLLIGISTAGIGDDTLLRRLCDEGERDDDPRYYYKWYGLPMNSPLDIRSREAFIAANPAMWEDQGVPTFIVERVMEDNARRMTEGQYRRYHLNQWTDAEDAFITSDMWDACTDMPEISDGQEAILSVDIGIKHDSSVVATIRRDKENRFHVKYKFWIPTPGHDVELGDVMEYIRSECEHLKVRAVLYDKYFFAYSAEILTNERLPMIEFPQNSALMCPATMAFHDAIVQKRVLHGNDAEARKQTLSAGVHDTERGQRLMKSKSKDRIDAAVATAMGIEYYERIPLIKRKSRYVAGPPPGMTSEEWKALQGVTEDQGESDE